MLAYPKDKLNVWMNRKLVEEAADQELIKENEKRVILSQMPQPFFNPSPIVRIGLGFGTLVATSTFFFLVSMIFSFSGYALFFIQGVALFILLETLISKKFHFRSGIDDILLYQAFSMLLAGFAIAMEFSPSSEVIISVVAVILTGFGAMRYADRIMSVGCLISFLILIGVVFDKINDDLFQYFPLICLVISLCCWYISSRLEQRPEFIYYQHCLAFLQVCSLAIAGIFSNYYMVEQFWQEMHIQRGGPGLFWKIFFISTTILVPVICLLLGIRKKDKILIRLGALMVTGAVMTFNHYFVNLPYELIWIKNGALLLVLSYFLLRNDKREKRGINFRERKDGRALHELEALMTGAGLGMVSPRTETGKFGGGSFGGAGAGGQF